MMVARVLTSMACLILLAADDAEADRKKLQGKWVMVAFEKEGSKLPLKALEDNTLTVEGEKWVYESKSLGYEKKVAFRLDPSTTPKGIDMMETLSDKERLTRGIYKIEGDTLTICRAGGDGRGPRPKRFSGDDRGVVLMVWKRAKK
jgi:uncharacterized protein (TIGR03067 family)